jgi:hypothetical protein
MMPSHNFLRLLDGRATNRPAIIIWAFWKEVPGILWEDAELLPPIYIQKEAA